ncbi:Uncharacterised protein r2_g3548 [Pycnogonum litorale]
MQKILNGLPGVLCQMDDVLIYGKCQSEHDANLRAVLQRIQRAGLTLNNKCEFSKRQIEFLGHIIDENGIRPSPKKVTAIAKMPPPKDISGLKSFLGMANQLGKFTPRLADLSKPLRDLLVKDTAWVWDQPQKDAFDLIKRELSQAPSLISAL